MLEGLNYRPLSTKSKERERVTHLLHTHDRERWMSDSQRPTFCGIILAAGPTREWGAIKPCCLGLPRKHMTQLRLFSEIATRVIVVAGTNCGAIADTVSSHGAILCVNASPEEGQFSSLQVALSEASAHQMTQSHVRSHPQEQDRAEEVRTRDLKDRNHQGRRPTRRVRPGQRLQPGHRRRDHT